MLITADSKRFRGHEPYAERRLGAVANQRNDKADGFLKERLTVSRSGFEIRTF